MTSARTRDSDTARRFSGGGVSWSAVLRRTVREFREDSVTDWAAALTYYGVLSIFPALIALVSIVGLTGSSTTEALLDNLRSFTPGPARDILTNAVTGLSENQSAGGFMFVIGLAVAFWSASGYVAAFMRATNVIWDAPEGRPIWKTVPLRVGVTVVTLVVLSVGAMAVVVSGPVAVRAGELLGLGSASVTAWEIAKWPLLVLLLALLLSFLYYASPNVKQPGFRWVTPGGVLAIILWIAASGAFALYVAIFASYNTTYGALGGVVVFLVWLWISNIAILLGAKLNAELERDRQLRLGHPDTEPFLPLRDEP